jgi:hypothetical protein
MRSVARKRRKLESRVAKGRRVEKILRARPIPAVLGPRGALYLIDCHHFGLALCRAEFDAAYARVIDDLSSLSMSEFWSHMDENGYLHPYDAFGRRIRPSKLPKDLNDLQHDPFRDLARDVREAGGFRKSRTPFAEFSWANYFRDEISLDDLQHDPDGAMRKAMKLAKRKQAIDLPGYIHQH